ncbi:Protoporphyrinogen oxidase [compost metagenome]
MKKVHVIGAGFAGLTVALRLAQKGFQVEIHEKSSRLGGLLGTETTEHGLVESAANSLIRTDLAEKLFTELNIPLSLPLESSKKRFIFRGLPQKWPLKFFETIGFVGRLVPKILFAKDKLKPSAGQTLSDWGTKNLGTPGTQFLLEPAMQGIYANGISGLSASLILGPLFNRKKAKYRGLLTGPRGMQGLIDGLAQRLQELNVQINLNSTVEISSLQGPVVVATSASAASQILKTAEPQLSGLLAQIPMSSLMSTTLFFNQAQTTYQGFGCLIPRQFGLKTLGILMNPYIFEGRNKTYNETWIIGGIDQGDLLQLSDTEVLKLIAEERFRILQSKEGLVDYRIHRWPNALPYYGLELETVLKSLPPTKNIYLHGNYLGGLGLSKILERSENLAEEISKSHG